uniref:Defensin, isoforms B and C n=1 Tax=Zophobas atratus TaxID=7074 RepID=DEFA_ZOPAT|nr:RecName: Full=Defensin, isoforms B and C [Zophobas atratus]AAB20745.1 peptide B [Zophobas atratus, Peptide, 43 aa] [Zophobas atratus]
FTCDVLGFEIAGTKLNSAACGAHCLALGRRGGYCNSKSVCVCR